MPGGARLPLLAAVVLQRIPQDWVRARFVNGNGWPAGVRVSAWSLACGGVARRRRYSGALLPASGYFTPVSCSEMSQRRRWVPAWWEAGMDSTLTGWPVHSFQPSGP